MKGTVARVWMGVYPDAAGAVGDAIVDQARSGDADAFATLYDVYAPRVYRFLIVRVREPADAEDLLQQVFIKTIQALPRYESRGLPFAAWLFKIAQNVVVDFHRSHRETETLDAALRAGSGSDPELEAQLGADQEHVRMALDRLTAPQREVLIYRFFAGLDTAEIGRAMGKREGTVRALQFRALESMRATLGASEGPTAR